MNPLTFCPACCIWTESSWWHGLVYSLAAKQGFIDTHDFFVLNESSAKVTLLTSIMSAAFFSFPQAEWMLSEDCRQFLMLLLSFLGDTTLPCCFPVACNLCEQLSYWAFRNCLCQVTYINNFLLVVLLTTGDLSLRMSFKPPVLCDFLMLLTRNSQSVKNASVDCIVSIYV